MNTPLTIQWTCASCDRETTVKVWPIVPAKVFGPPENCYPAEGGEIEPDQCEHCGARIDAGLVHEKEQRKADDMREAAAEARYDARREEGL